MNELLDCTDSDLLRLAQGVYEIPSLAAWRAAELRALRHCAFPSPVLEIGCGNGRFTSLLLKEVDWGIDLNPRQIADCSRENRVYRRVGCMDARRLRFADGVFATVFANCVIEHVLDLPRVLAECRRVLRSGGKLITTVPLAAMNLHLTLRKPWYGRWRSNRLQHRHLLPENGWVEAFHGAGFTSVETTPYLSGSLCKLWDRVDGPMCLGAGPLTVGALYRTAMRLVPAAGRSKLNRQWQRYFMKALCANPSDAPCAMLIQATVQSDGSPKPSFVNASAPQPAT